MLCLDGYSLEYYKNRNEIVITLPQTAETATNTVSPIVKRAVDIDSTKLLPVLLMVIRTVYEIGEEKKSEQ